MLPMNRLFSWLSRKVHRHEWEDTRINPFGVATEQRCKCGAYQHHTANDLSGVEMGEDTTWHDGRHPGDSP